MSETAQPKKPTSWLIRVIGMMALAGVAAFAYVLFQGVSKPEAGSFSRFATGGLEKLIALPDPPPQPAVKFTDAAGAETSLAAFRGKAVVVNLWATWCAPCVKEMPTLGKLAGAMKGQDVAVVAISVDRVGDRTFAIEQLAKLSGGKLAFYHDPAYAIAFDAKTQGFPTTIIYDKRGHELARVSGEAEWDGPEARALIEAAMAE